MAKSITFFDKEHTGGINLAAMEDTQLKENLVKDIAAGGDEAPTATAVKEAIEAKMGNVDIINDLTTGGVDKALSAEQGKVLDEKKVDKVVTPASVYVTEGSKPLSDFAMKAEVTDFVELDSASMPNTLATLAGISEDGIFKKWVYVDTAELGTAKDGDVVQLTITGKNYFGILGGPQVGTGATLDDEMLNTTLPASGNWQGWSRIYIANSVDNVKVVNSKVDKIDTPDSVYTTNGSKPLAEFVVDTDIINDLTTGGADKVLSAEQGKELDGKKVDRIVTPASVYVTEGSKQLADFTMKAEVGLSGTGETFISMPNLNGFNTDKGISSSIFFVHPDDLGSIKSTLNKGDIVSFKPSGDVKGNVTAVFSHITTELTPNDNHILNETDNGFSGWYAFTILSSDYDRVQMSNKTQGFNVRLQASSDTFNSMYDLSDSAAPNSRCAFYVKPADIASLKLRRGDTVTFSPATGSGKTTGTIVAIYDSLANTSITISKQPCLNKTNPASGNFGGWYIFNVVSSDYDRTHGTVGQRTYTVTYGDDLPLGLRGGYNIILKANAALTALLPSLRYGDFVELANTNKNYVYITKFIRLCTSADNANKGTYVVGQDTIPNDITGWPILAIIWSSTDLSNRPVQLTTGRYQASQFTVGNTYKIKYELSGTDTMYIPNNPNIAANKFTANKLAIYEALLYAGLIRLRLDSNTKYVDLNLVSVEYDNGKYTATGICISKASANVTDLSGA